jgi:hypothetical protein
MRENHADLRKRLVHHDRLVALTGLASAFSALPLSRTMHGPEAAATLAVAAIALLAGQRWALGLVAVSELLLLAALASFVHAADLATATSYLLVTTSAAMMIPGLWSLRRAASTLVCLFPRYRNQKNCRRVFSALRATAAVALLVPFLN